MNMVIIEILRLKMRYFNKRKTIYNNYGLYWPLGADTGCLGVDFWKEKSTLPAAPRIFH